MLVLIAGAAAALPGAEAGERRCDGINVVVSGADAEDTTAACEASADALRFLGRHGLDVGMPVEVRVATKLPDAVSPHAAGCYIHAEQRVYILSFLEFGRQGSFLDEPADRVLYRSLITHEVAHAIAACNFAVSKPTIQAQEYVAYVTMFATMPEPQRQRALDRFPGDGFTSEAAMNSTVYLMDPDRFGAEAYRHFVKPGNGPAFLQRVLDGSALSWDPF